MGEIKLSLPEYQELISQRDDALKRCIEAEKETAKAAMMDPEDRIPGLVRCIRAGLSVVEFAVGNLAPETVRGWPYDDLIAFANELEKIPGADTCLKEYALSFRNFVREAQEVEEVRRRKDEASMTTPSVDAIVDERPTGRPRNEPL